ncbi:MAG: HPr family phosphocarrier protein [Gammaproteobacteria bacterium]|nr:HPr family phosphocarrier protein [Gammaproteobacteria bacterium]
MIVKEFEIINKLGLHARAAAKLVGTTAQFVSDIQITKDTHTVNGKSIMGVMMLAAAKGTWISVRVEGEDEDRAMEAIEALIKDYFGEGE